ncbi:MAG: methionine--tRNA ligase [candidate division Zixibacteria bacterium]|nr:methionine--tRNA ligase [candidate division Zixibacteria bacterium]
MKKNIYITTPIYYVNDKPHIGHSFTTIVGDVLARFHRISGRATYYVTGTDEHGAKVAEEARLRGLTPQELCDRNAALYKQAWEKLNISYDYFVRTTDKRHQKAVEKLLDAMHRAKVSNGEPVIYQGEYSGLYCLGCEKFLTEKELTDGKCPNHLTVPQRITEKNYFFRLTAFLPQVENLIKTGKIKIIPEERKAETLGLFKQNLEDFSVSREKVTWGIPLPFDPNQIAYVWVDALPNYISAIGYGDNPQEFKKWWEEAEVIHLMAKDILKFHNIFWPAMLLSVGLKTPDTIVNHGFFTVQGQKMSKSLGNVIDPVFIVEKFGPDAARYLLLTQFPFGLDGDIQADRFEEKYNSELANDLGNLVSRTGKMIYDYCGGKIPKPPDSLFSKGPDKSPKDQLRDFMPLFVEKFIGKMNELKVTAAIEEVFYLVKLTNVYIEANAPWVSAKLGNMEQLNKNLYMAADSIRLISELLYPVMPKKAVEIRRLLGFSEKQLLPLLPTENNCFGILKPGQKLGELTPLFPRMENKFKKQKKEVKMPEEKMSQGTVSEDNQITIADFKKVQLKVGEIKTAEKVEKADKLLRLQVQIGNGQKQIVAGIAEHYKPEELIGKKVIVVDNLKPAVFRGEKSEGMILAASEGGKLALLTPEKEIPSGATIS